jgi:ribosomal protein S18 acetylase RimI-like enzyme
MIGTQKFEASEHLLLKKMTKRDIPAVVQVHQQSFVGFFLTFLGPTFLCELYTAVLIDPSGICFIVERQGNVIGFVIGTEQSVGLYRRLLYQRWWRFAVAAVRPLLSRPAILLRLLRAFSAHAAATQVNKRGTLMSIAVLPDRQYSGVGKMLVKAFLQEAAHRGLYQVDLTTDRDHNEAANRFYQKLGFVCTRSFTTPEGRVMNEYVIDLPISSNEKQSKSHVSIPPQGEYIA